MHVQSDGIICHYFSGVCCDHFMYTRINCIQIFILGSFSEMLQVFSCVIGLEMKKSNKTSKCVLFIKHLKTPRYKRSVIM